MHLSSLIFPSLAMLLFSQAVAPLTPLHADCVTIEQYTDFLNAVAKEDLHTLYEEKMALDPTIAHIERAGAPGHYHYSINRQEATQPISYVDAHSAMRFCNWKENGAQHDPATTEYGVYQLQEKTCSAPNAAARFHLPKVSSDALFPNDRGMDISYLVEGSMLDESLRSNRLRFCLDSVSTAHEAATNATLSTTDYVLGGAAAILCLGLGAYYVDRNNTVSASRGGNIPEPARGIPDHIGSVETLRQPLQEAKAKIQERIASISIAPRASMLSETNPHALSATLAAERQQLLQSHFQKSFGEAQQRRTEDLLHALSRYDDPTLYSESTKILSFGYLREKNKVLLADTEKYCTDFDAAQEDALKKTTFQFQFLTQLRQHQSDVACLQEVFSRFKEQLPETPDSKEKRAQAITTFFKAILPGENFAAQKTSVEKRLVKYHQACQKVEEECGPHSHFSEFAPFFKTDYSENVQSLLQQIDDQKQELHAQLQHLHQLFAAATTRYDAVPRQVSPKNQGSEKKTSLSNEDEWILENALRTTNLRYDPLPYPKDEAGQHDFLQQQIRAQYDTALTAIKEHRRTSYREWQNGFLEPEETTAMDYFLTLIDEERFPFLKKTVEELRQNEATK